MWTALKSKVPSARSVKQNPTSFPWPSFTHPMRGIRVRLALCNASATACMAAYHWSGWNFSSFAIENVGNGDAQMSLEPSIGLKHHLLVVTQDELARLVILVPGGGGLGGRPSIARGTCEPHHYSGVPGRSATGCCNGVGNVTLPLRPAGIPRPCGGWSACLGGTQSNEGACLGARSGHMLRHSRREAAKRRPCHGRPKPR